MMDNFYFEYSYFLILIPIYTFIIFYFKQKQQSYFIPNIISIISSMQKKKDFKQILKYLIFLLSIIALASPIEIKHLIDREKHTLDIVLSIDTSGSMSLNGFNELDYNQTRLSAVKNIVKDFIKERGKDRIALVVFGDSSSVVSPLSYDNKTPLNIIDKITIGIVGKSTAIIDSIVQSTGILKNSFSSSKIIILLSDGDDTASKIPLEIALKIVKKYKIKIYTISIGESNNNLMSLISKESGANSFIATNAKNLGDIYKNITKLEETTHNTKKIEVIVYYYKYFLYFALALALTLAWLSKKDERF